MGFILLAALAAATFAAERGHCVFGMCGRYKDPNSGRITGIACYCGSSALCVDPASGDTCARRRLEEKDTVQSGLAGALSGKEQTGDKEVKKRRLEEKDTVQS